VSTVVIQTKQGIGDCIWHLPFIRAIATAAGESVTLLSLPSTHAQELLQAEPSIARMLYFENRGPEWARGVQLVKLIGMLRGLACRTVWILDRSARPAFAAKLAGVPNRIGLGFGQQSWFITNAGIDKSFYHAHPIDWLKALMQATGVALPSTEPNLSLPQELTVAVHARFERAARPWIVLGLGAAHPPRDWSDASWLEFIGVLRARIQGTVFLIGGPRHADRASRLIAQTAGAQAVNACDLSVVESAALLSLADLFVGPDSGPLNLAAAVGTRAFGLFGMSQVLDYSYHIVPISPDDGGPPTPDGMRRISPQNVLQRIAPYLG
jgi:heptosyltransferase-2